MSYKSEFASNNADLQTILDVVNGLPDKDSGIPVEITGSVDSTYYNYVIINGITYKEATSGVTVKSGDVITFYTKYIFNSTAAASLKINGETVFTVSSTAQTYEFVVPQDVISISIALDNMLIEVTTEVGSVDTGASESTFAPTDSGGTTYKSKFADNNVDLQKILDKVNSL